MTTATKTETRPEVTLPAFKAKLGSLQMSVWANEHVSQEGEVLTFHTLNIDRSYPDESKPNGWGRTRQLRARDVGDAIALLQQGQQYLIKTE